MNDFMSSDVLDPSVRRYRRNAASRYLEQRWGLSYKTSTLSKLAVTGGGPSYRLAGRFPVYFEPDLDEWAAQKFSPLKYSTSDLGEANPHRRPTLV